MTQEAMRMEFEAWARSEGLEDTSGGGRGFDYPLGRKLWQCWQASRAQGAAPTGDAAIVAAARAWGDADVDDPVATLAAELALAHALAGSNAEGPKPDGLGAPLTEKEAATFVNVHTVWSDFAGHFVVDGFGLIRDVEAHHGILPPAPPSSSQEGG